MCCVVQYTSNVVSRVLIIYWYGFMKICLFPKSLRVRNLTVRSEEFEGQRNSGPLKKRCSISRVGLSAALHSVRTETMFQNKTSINTFNAFLRPMNSITDTRKLPSFLIHIKTHILCMCTHRSAVICRATKTGRPHAYCMFDARILSYSTV
jgi:hypothetical protein